MQNDVMVFVIKPIFYATENRELICWDLSEMENILQKKFQMHFSERKIWYLDTNFTVCLNWQ